MNRYFPFDNTQNIANVFAGGTSLFPVNEVLEPYILSLVHGVIEHPQLSQFAARPIPTGYVVMFIHSGCSLEIYNHDFKLTESRKYFVTGVHKLDEITFLRAHGKIDNLVITFKPGAFSRIFGCSAFLIMNRVVDLEDLLTPDMFELIGDIAGTLDVQQRVLKLNDFLADMLKKSTFNTRKNHIEVLELINKHYGNVNLKQIYANLNVSARTMQRSFQVNVGISPKEYIRIVRFNSLFQYLLSNRMEDWQEIIYRFGYYDQSHFIHDFKSVTGFPPLKFIDFSQHGTIFLDRFQVVHKVSDLMR